MADVVDMVKHQHTNIFIDWKPEKVELLDYKESENRFFVRTDSPKAEVEAVFGKVEYIDGVAAGEYAFTTDLMKEGDFQDKAQKINILNRIRLG